MGTLLMMFANKIVRKANQIRKQNWSAPSVMSAFIIFCMFMVYSFETIGILNKDRNIDFRITTPETNIKTYNKINKISSNVINFSGEIISDKNREENLEKIRQIMLDGAMEQIQLESCTEIEESENENGNKKPEAMLEFFDV